MLDPDKVQRLVVGSRIGYVEYTRARQLLGLRNYGFRLSILPAFDVSVGNLEVDDNELEFEAKVSFNDGRPISNAFVDITIIYLFNKECHLCYICK